MTPVKGNNNFEGSGEFNFVITPATLEKDTGSLKIYNDRNEELTGPQSFKYDGTAHILVVAKGNYKAAGTYTDVNGNKIENVVIDKTFSIEKLAFEAEDITVSNGAYKGGYDVEPEVTVSYKGQTLVKDRDYELVFINGQDRTNVTNGKTLDV